MAASPTRAPLMPTVPSQLNIKSAEAGSNTKRKRPEETHTDFSDAFFTARAVSTMQKSDSCTFRPITTIARRNLPLAWLNPTQTHRELPLGYVFVTDKRLLDENHENILVARLCSYGGLYAIDNATVTTYTAWPLIAWVSEELCCDAAQNNRILPSLEQLGHKNGHHSRTTSFSSDLPTQATAPRSPKQAKNRRGAMARMSIITPKDSFSMSPAMRAVEIPKFLSDIPQIAQDECASETPILETSAILEDSAPHLNDLSRTDVPTTSTDQHFRHRAETMVSEFNASSTSPRPEQLGAESLLHQYFETLYLSKASLAFWAKGPLSRARAQARKPDADFGLHALKECYLSMVLPTKKIDTKYKDTINSVVNDSSTRSQDVPDPLKPGRRKQPRKTKLGKNCLYTSEEEHILRWWMEKDTMRAMTTSAALHEADQKKALSELRNRETAMQLLLILEVLYIETLLSRTVEAAVGSPGLAIKVESVEEDNAALHVKPARIKKQRDLGSELDANAERLSIWHTVALGDTLSSPEKATEDSESTIMQSKDALRDFCRDVIIPFYSVKVPEQAKSICRKLGGPQISPQRPRSQPAKGLGRPASSAGLAEKPRAVLKRSLQRVLSEDQTVRSASPPILSRSSTISHVPKLRRELSEIDGRPASRSGMQKSVSFSNREIDLIADAKAHNTKKRKLEKLATQKKELEEAIDALKKPNRTNAAKSFMDEIESRNADTRTGAVHISATPRRAKPRSSSSATTAQSQFQPPRTSVFDAAVVLSSTLKSSHLQPTLSMPASSKKKRAVLSAIHDTPSRGLSKLSNPLAMVEATPAADRLRSDLPTDTPLPTRLTTKSGKPVLFTPIKRKDVDVQNAFLFRNAPEISEQAGKAMDRVMGGKGIEETLSFELYANNLPHGRASASEGIETSNGGHSHTITKGTEDMRTDMSTSGKEKSIYEALGWDDFDDI